MVEIHVRSPLHAQGDHQAAGGAVLRNGIGDQPAVERTMLPAPAHRRGGGFPGIAFAPMRGSEPPAQFQFAIDGRPDMPPAPWPAKSDDRSVGLGFHDPEAMAMILLALLHGGGADADRRHRTCRLILALAT